MRNVIRSLFVILASTPFTAQTYVGFSEFGFPNGGAIHIINPSDSSENHVYEIETIGLRKQEKAVLTEVQSNLFYGVHCGSDVKIETGYIFKYNAVTHSTEIVHLFETPYGREPQSGLVLHPNGKLYGTTTAGGNYGKGTIFEYNPTNNAFTVLYHFGVLGTDARNTVEKLIVLPDQKLFGVSSQGGMYNRGALYTYDINTGVYNRVFSFPYGTGIKPIGRLTLKFGKIWSAYQTTDYFAKLYTINYDGSNFQLVANTVDCYQCDGSLNDIQWYGDTLYGIVSHINMSQGGVIKYYPQSNLWFKVHSFISDSTYNTIGIKAMQIGSNNILYGLNDGTPNSTVGMDESFFFRFSLLNDQLIDQRKINPNQLEIPNASITVGNDNRVVFYTDNGIYQHRPNNNSLQRTFRFRNNPIGTSIRSNPVQFNKNIILGSTVHGGQHGNGTVFAYNIENDFVEPLYHFAEVQYDHDKRIFVGDNGNIYFPYHIDNKMGIIELNYWSRNIEHWMSDSIAEHFKWSPIPGFMKDNKIYSSTGIFGVNIGDTYNRVFSFDVNTQQIESIDSIGLTYQSSHLTNGLNDSIIILVDNVEIKSIDRFSHVSNTQMSLTNPSPIHEVIPKSINEAYLVGSHYQNNQNGNVLINWNRLNNSFDTLIFSSDFSIMGAWVNNAFHPDYNEFVYGRVLGEYHEDYDVKWYSYDANDHSFVVLKDLTNTPYLIRSYNRFGIIRLNDKLSAVPELPLFDKNISVKVFPNPANGLVKISNESPFALNILHFVDVNGKQISTFENAIIAPNSSQSVNIEKLDPGVYYLSIEFQSGEVVCKKVIVM